MTASTRRALSAVAIVCVAVAVQRAATSGWARAATADGTRYTLSPVGLSRAGVPGVSASAAYCRWWPMDGDRTLCAVGAGGAAAHERLRLAYPLLFVGLWTAVLSLVLQVIRIPASAARQSVLPIAVCVCTLVAIAIVRDAPNGLAVLQGVPVRFDTVGFGLVVAAAGLSAISATLLLGRELRSVPKP
jgi:hypothetical protein